ncbi:DUF421 domain-containing protein [Bacillus sp. USDA818B3_A]|uniref:DUF421 domain-containing protein n=1 Tax=Bacillus sp. USDA818B3_A TaxID=2698834 RepID=UPI00136ED9AB|nr:DUF421 domain-containing protein [Bacillus sp. USDA818B3_A]
MYIDITLELIVGFLTLLLVLKFLGKIQFSQITPFDFITGLVMGNFVGDAVFDEKVDIPEVVYTIVLWGLLIYCVERLTQRNTTLRVMFEGKPSLLIKKGEILYKNLKKNHVDLNQLQQMLRKLGYFSIYEAEYVILERDGQISVVPKHKYGAPTKQDLKIPEKKFNLPVAFIMDGKLIKRNLSEAGFNEDWLKKQLSQKNINNYKEVLYAEWEENRGLNISKYN